MRHVALAVLLLFTAQGCGLALYTSDTLLHDHGAQVSGESSGAGSGGGGGR